MICDFDFQSDGANLGVIKVGNRFYAAAIDKNAVRFKGESYEVLTQKLSDRSTSDFLYKSRMDDQLIAVVYQIAQALAIHENDQCDFDRIFSNQRVQATYQLTIFPDNRCTSIKKSALSIVGHYQKFYGEDFLETYSEREVLRMKIADQVLSNVECNESQYNAIKNIIVEDLRGPYYRQLFSNQAKQLISHDDINNSSLLETILSDVVEEHGIIGKKDTQLCRF